MSEPSVAGRVKVRDVDALDPLPDEKLKIQDASYLERHKIDKLFGDILMHMIEEKPQDPIQYIIDSIEYNTAYAKQDEETGLPEHRKVKLMDVFRVIDKEGMGRISFNMLKQFVDKYGGSSITNEELQSIFKDFQPDGVNMITLDEFMAFFSKVSQNIHNAAFEKMVQELMA